MIDYMTISNTRLKKTFKVLLRIIIHLQFFLKIIACFQNLFILIGYSKVVMIEGVVMLLYTNLYNVNKYYILVSSPIASREEQKLQENSLKPP